MRQKVFPLPTSRAPSASNSPSALSAQAHGLDNLISIEIDNLKHKSVCANSRSSYVQKPSFTKSVKLWLVWKISRKLYVRPNFVSWAKYIENNCAKLDTFLCSARSVLEKMIGRTTLVQRTMQEMLGKYLENNHQTGNNTGGRYGKSVIRCTKHGLP